MFRGKKNRKKRSTGERIRATGRSIWRRVRPVGRYVVLLAVFVGIAYVAVTGYDRVITSPYFELSEVEMNGVRWSDRDELAHRSGLLRGVNVFDVDFSGARKAIEANPWIEQAEVIRDLPDRVVVNVEERQPQALLVDGGYTVLDGSGAPITKIRPEKADEALFDLPLITGLTSRELKQGRGRRLVRRALVASRHYADLGLADGEWGLSELHLEPVLGLTLVTRGGTEIRLGNDRWEERIDRLESVRKTLENQEIEAGYILLDHRLDEKGGLKRVTVGRRQHHGTVYGDAE